MPAPRMSQSAEAARAAALQAEFNEKKWVWVPDDKDGYLAGWVHQEDSDFAQVVMASGGEIRQVPLYALSKLNPPKFDRVDDIADLTFLNEASVVHNLRLRYGSGVIYTYSGLFLVAVNPYQNLPLYSDTIIQQYRNKRRDENPPHIFAVAERAWINMGEERENQSILITGESGAGKTESTKKVIQYLSAIATDVHLPASSHTQQPSISSLYNSPPAGAPRNSQFRRSLQASQSGGSSLTSRGRLGLLERQIIQANPILEAFGNAQTQRNNNSSRFGKFIRISFAPDGSISGANIDWYLLEKSRVVVRSEAERNFHVFYELLMSNNESLKKSLLLDGDVEDYEYLNKSRREVDGVNDKDEWDALINAFDTVGFSSHEQLDLFRIVAAVLHIGNIVITSTKADDAVLPDPSQAERACHLLGVPVAEFTKAILRPKVLAGREWVTQARTRQQALEELASLCKTLYEKSFGALVDRINRALDRPSSKSTFIGVLDIAGFEIFDVNNYEQLLINWTNEKLQQFFNYHMFVLEQEEYAREGIEWDYVNFGLDLQPTIDLIEVSGPTIGILSCLDEECIMPKATDLTFTNKCHALWSGDVRTGEEPHPGREKYSPTRFAQGFVISHYAGKVEYRTDGWLEKNKDPLNDNLGRVLAASSDSYVASLFQEHAGGYVDVNGNPNPFTVGKKRGIKKGAFRTVAQRHREQLSLLMAQLQATQPHFVRCIVPNGNKKPGRIDVPLVLDQLRCNGVLEGIRIARLGYPNRLPFVEFRQRYEILTPGIIPRGYMDGRKACLRMVEALELDDGIYRVGTSKIFFKAGVLAELEERRDSLLFDIFSRLQAVARKYSARRQMKKVLNRAVAIRTIQKNARVYGELRDWPWWQLYTKVRPLLAATRNDEELRRKEVELQLARERAERDQRERETLENLKMGLESEKRKVEDELEAERALALDKDALLERSKKRESELEEEITALHADLDVLDSQLDRALKMQKEGEEKHEALRLAFDQAAEHLVRMEQDQNSNKVKEEELMTTYATTQQELGDIQEERERLVKEKEDLQALLTVHEEDLARVRERADAAHGELIAKLTEERRNNDAANDKIHELEQTFRQSKEQISEMNRTANEYSAMIQQKEDVIAGISRDLAAVRSERSQFQKETFELQNKIEIAKAEAETAKEDAQRSAASRTKLQEELDELRTLMETKTSEETRRMEVEKSKEMELSNLRSQVETLQTDLSTTRNSAAENERKLRAELEEAHRERASLEESHKSLTGRERSMQSNINRLETINSELEKTKRSMESELARFRSRQVELDSQIADATKTKDSLSRQLSQAQSKAQDFEDANLQLERQIGQYERQMESTRKQLEAETAKRQQLQTVASSQKTELVTTKEKLAKFEEELNKTLKDLKNKEWECRQLESKQDKTIVEHVHVLEEAKRVTDKQLSTAQQELQKNATYIRSLEKARNKLMREAEDSSLETRREQLEFRAAEKNAQLNAERAEKAIARAESEKKAKEAAELQVRRLQSELHTAHAELEGRTDELLTAKRSKEQLENELAHLVDEMPMSDARNNTSKEAEQRIAELERQLADATSSEVVLAQIQHRVDQQHRELRALIMKDAPKNDSFRKRLMQELQAADEALAKEVKAHIQQKPSRNVHFNLPPSPAPKKAPRPSLTDPKPDRQNDELKQQVQTLEIRIEASERVRQHYESVIRDMTSDLENINDAKEFLQKCRRRLSEENARLSTMLDEEANVRRTAESSEDVQAVWAKFRATLDEEQLAYGRLEESRKALLVQQRNTQAELEEAKKGLRDNTHSKKRMQAELEAFKEALETEKIRKNEALDASRGAQAKLQELQVDSGASIAMQSELRAAMEAYRQKSETMAKRADEADIAKEKATRTESLVRRSLADAEKALGAATSEKNNLQSRLEKTERRLLELEKKLHDEGEESSELSGTRQRLFEQLQEERQLHQKDLAERDFASDQTRKKYQAELAQLSDELQSQRDTMSRLREDNRKLRSDYDDLQLRFDDEVYNGGAWKKEKERYETKIDDLTKAYESSVTAQSDQQNQIVSLHSQVRELRGVLNDAEADRALLQKARRALQAELESIKLDHADTSKMANDTEFQKLLLQKQDLKRSLEEQEDRTTMAFERLKKAEAYANDCQAELNQTRGENTELERMNGNLEKQIKDLKVTIVDLETRSYSSSPQPSTVMRQLQERIADLTKQLHESQSGTQRRMSSDKMMREAQNQLAESQRQRIRLEEERHAFEAQLAALRQDLDRTQTDGRNLQRDKRRVDREAADFKQKALNLEREVERLRGRVSRPSSVVSSVVSALNGSSRKSES
ncbi:nonmuscle myosin heavy chain b [Coniophora puteana RWD-64-598 SS2]|uniref:Nonmuscle myosin heavy chain b n=1 Tax=Coniophora puteana (strain RWD-64-598) TaxID=741705 RepID=A0A5M3M9U7_CONPW|nr:nonmuscle myosin heavy chain b [Coniophora puteana RWD-64-598 SS2]EIW76062.1 nonmuscle myosin heavy chain b [Coniophora puteana RWD-64-598 SS2]